MSGGLKLRAERYEQCAANKTIHGEQCIVCWYVDDTKISYTYSKVVAMAIKETENRFGKFVISRGKEYTFVGMDI